MDWDDVIRLFVSIIICFVAGDLPPKNSIIST